MSPTTSLELVIFDCDAVLVDSERLIDRLESELTSERFAASRRGRVIDQDVCVTWHVPSAHCTEMWARFADQDSCDRFWEAP